MPLLLSFTLLTTLSACSIGQPVSTYPEYRPTPGQGQYVRPQYLNRQLPPRVPNDDLCQSRLYAGLVGQHEGAIFIAGLPGRKRLIKPAVVEGFGYGAGDPLYIQTPYVEVREFLAGQNLYASTNTDLRDRLNLGPDIADRLTIELDEDGYVQQIDCR